jgi:hypothetical protein
MHGTRLWGVPATTPAEVLRTLGAMQAQEFGVAKWSIAQRTTGATDASLAKLFDAGAILRTHVLRPTWHFVLPADIRWMLELTAPRVKARMAPYDRRLELTEKVYDKANAVIAEAVRDGHRTRAELGDALESRKIPARGQRLGHIVSRAELEQIVCSGAMRGKQHTYASLAERAPKAKRLSREAALTELTKRYFTARGPATLNDFTWWSSLTAAEARAGIESLGSGLERAVVDGRTYWFVSGAAGAKPRSPVVDLVQVYDEVVMSYRESRDVLISRAATTFVSGALVLHPILVDGGLIGHWRPRRDAVEIQPYVEVTATQQRAIDRAVERFRKFAVNGP